jgi:hypothetical protein
VLVEANTCWLKLKRAIWACNLIACLVAAGAKTWYYFPTGKGGGEGAAPFTSWSPAPTGSVAMEGWLDPCTEVGQGGLEWMYVPPDRLGPPPRAFRSLSFFPLLCPGQ